MVSITYYNRYKMVTFAGNFGRGHRKLGHHGGTSRNVSITLKIFIYFDTHRDKEMKANMRRKPSLFSYRVNFNVHKSFCGLSVCLHITITSNLQINRNKTSI